MQTIKSNKKKPRVLVGVPTSKVKNYCWDEFRAKLKKLSYAQYDIAIAENSDGRKNLKKIRALGFNTIRIKPKRKSVTKILAESHNALRRYAIANKYDYLLHLESDVFPPNDIIERLLAHKKKVVSAAYPINFGDKSHIMCQLIEEGNGSIKETSILKNGADFMSVGKGLKKVFNAGLGCILIHRSILRKVKFRSVEDAFLHPDTLFALDLDGNKIPVYLDTDTLCEHKNAEWIYA